MSVVYMYISGLHVHRAHVSGLHVHHTHTHTHTGLGQDIWSSTTKLRQSRHPACVQGHCWRSAHTHRRARTAPRARTEEDYNHLCAALRLAFGTRSHKTRHSWCAARGIVPGLPHCPFCPPSSSPPAPASPQQLAERKHIDTPRGRRGAQTRRETKRGRRPARHPLYKTQKTLDERARSIT